MRRILIAGLVLLAACGDGGADPTIATVPSGTGDSATSTTAPSPDTTGVPAQAIPEELVNFIDGIEEALVGTAYEGAALEDPDVFLATGALFCEQLDAGIDADAVLVGYVEALTGGSVDEASDDDLVLAGSLLGVGVATLCPRHEDSISG
ncbi:MAG: hypothetical protein OEM22_05250 [Acidimicrobiia bacterium]|nr:hypothetical protein [Acidimicrobiia bacterium]MDH3471571.1 hypothetical protein [Acidimicrobiia bacterium]